MGYRGHRKHLKRLNAPKKWILDKRGGNFAPKPSCGPHKMRECLPLCLFLRNKMHYALNYNECGMIMCQRLVKVDGKIRTDKKYPSGFMDVISIPRTGEYCRLLYDVKGRFVVHKIRQEEANYKLCRVRKVLVGPKNTPFIVTHDGRTIQYPDPLIKRDDTIKFDFDQNKITGHIKFETNNLVMITGGANLGRVGVITHRGHVPGSNDLITVTDMRGHVFSTVIKNVFVIGKGNTPWISLPKGQGIKLSIIEERDKRLSAKRNM